MAQREEGEAKSKLALIMHGGQLHMGGNLLWGAGGAEGTSVLVNTSRDRRPVFCLTSSSAASKQYSRVLAEGGGTGSWEVLAEMKMLFVNDIFGSPGPCHRLITTNDNTVVLPSSEME